MFVILPAASCTSPDCVVDSCMTCDSCKAGEEHFCDNGATKFTYGYPSEAEPTGITQGGYSDKIVVRDHFAVHIPENITFEEAAPLLCAGITTYSPLMRAQFRVGDKVFYGKITSSKTIK